MNSGMAGLKEHFGELEDPRAQHRIEHLLIDIVLITICAVMCGAESWVDIENYGLAKQEWLSQFLALPNGIPSHDTFSAIASYLKSAMACKIILPFSNALIYLRRRAQSVSNQTHKKRQPEMIAPKFHLTEFLKRLSRWVC